MQTRSRRRTRPESHRGVPPLPAWPLPRPMSLWSLWQPWVAGAREQRGLAPAPRPAAPAAPAEVAEVHVGGAVAGVHVGGAVAAGWNPAAAAGAVASAEPARWEAAPSPAAQDAAVASPEPVGVEVSPEPAVGVAGSPEPVGVAERSAAGGEGAVPCDEAGRPPPARRFGWAGLARAGPAGARPRAECRMWMSGRAPPTVAHVCIGGP
jgi:hypothetical protein